MANSVLDCIHGRETAQQTAVWIEAALAVRKSPRLQSGAFFPALCRPQSRSGRNRSMNSKAFSKRIRPCDRDSESLPNPRPAHRQAGIVFPAGQPPPPCGRVCELLIILSFPKLDETSVGILDPHKLSKLIDLLSFGKRYSNQFKMLDRFIHKFQHREVCGAAALSFISKRVTAGNWHFLLNSSNPESVNLNK